MRILLLFLLLSVSLFSFAQDIQKSSTTRASLTSKSDQLGMPFTSANYPGTLNTGQTYSFTLSPDHLFSCFGVGFNAANHLLDPALFLVTYRTQRENGEWSEWTVTEGEITPEETPTNKYWTEALFTLDATSQQNLELKITVPTNVEGIQVDLFDGNFKGDISTVQDDTRDVDPTNLENVSRSNCPEFPTMITRSSWCGGSAPCWQVNSAYTPTYINAGHVVIHHGASPNTYSDGQAVVRSYYNYHVNTLGWADIGYNYLIDKYGNFYQGRHNPNLPTSDVRGAHAGAANGGSIGVNFLGNLDVSIATTAQLNKLYDLLAWWYDYKAINPLGSSNMQTQAYGVQYMENLTCHRDIGSTSCPGNDMYSRMSSIRQAIQDVIDNCNNLNADAIAPTTDVNTNYEWRGFDFWTEFDDIDNPGGSGIDRQYYQVLEYDGTEWRGNAENGFFSDNFNTAIHPDWTVQTGMWVISNGTILQSDEAEGNTNIHTAVNQTVDNKYLYQWSGMLDGTGTNRRSGIHFFADDPTQLQLGNSYMVYFRADDNEVHIYEANNNTIQLVANVPYTIDAGTWYDYKVTYDPSTGEIDAFVDNDRVASYIDGTPLTSGTHISLRNADAVAYFDNVKVRIDRDFQEKIFVGPQVTKDARYESPNQQQDACRVNSIVIDGADNWSASSAKNIYVDWTDPTTQASVGSSWQTEDFTASFQDEDNVDGSGIQKSFYQVIDFDGTKWRGNADLGFYSDNFDIGSIDPAWNVVNGSWNVTNGHLEQTDEALGNTNIYTEVKHDLSNRYLYHFQLKLDGSGTNRRGGMHYFSDNPTATNRGNSYFIWFRQELQTLEFYSVSNDTFTQEKVVPIEFDAATWMDIKIAYDRITGETFVYKDDDLMGEWIDDTPLSSGNYVSFRSGNSNFAVENFKVYRSRYPTVQVDLGTPSSALRYQNPDPNTISGKVKSIIQDTAQNLSAIDYLDLNIDWTPPVGLTSISDVSSVDADTFYTSNEITAYWNQAEDVNSEISHYEMSVGTTPGDSNSVAWTNVGNVLNSTLNSLSLTPGVNYFVNIRAVNNAGLKSSLISSDGQYLKGTAGIEDLTAFGKIVIYPNPFDGRFYVQFDNEVGEAQISLYDVNGKMIKSWEKNEFESKTECLTPALSKGTYMLKIQTRTHVYERKLVH
jgi:hypothetical protein